MNDGTWGRVGDPIPGSRFTRAFCADCGGPMRVFLLDLWPKGMPPDRSGPLPVYCRECDPPHTGVGSPSGHLNDVDSDPDAYLPSWRNA